MHPKIEELLAFVQVVEAGSISAASRRMGLSKSVVSGRIAALEARLAVTLLRRTTRSMVLTEVGAGFYEQARDILARLEHAAMEATGTGGHLRGLLRIAAPLSFGALHLGKLLMPFLQAHPGLECTIELDDRKVDLIEGRFDLAIRIGRLPDSSLVARRVGQSRRVVCCSPEYAARKGLPSHPDDLRAHDIIGYGHASAASVWTFEAEGRAAPFVVSTPRPQITANNGELIRDAALAGLGVTILPRFIVADALQSGTLIRALPGLEPVPEGIQLVYAQQRSLPLKTRMLIDHLVGAFGGQPW